MQNKMSLINFDARNDITVYTGLISTEMKWLFNKQLMPVKVLFIPYAYDGDSYNTYIQKVIQIFASFRVGVNLITDGKPADLIKADECIVVCGGSLEKLLEGISTYKSTLITALKNGIPYLGWNEGAVLPSPFYVVPALLPIGPKCLGVTKYQIYAHYCDSDPNRLEIQNFLINHQGETFSINKVICLSDQAGGSGIRLEDDDIALDYAGGSPAITNIYCALDSTGRLIIN